MGAGGTERLTIDLMSGFLRRGHPVDLVLLAQEGDLLDQVPDSVNIINLAVPRIWHALPPLRRYFQQHRPAGMIAALSPLTVIAALATRSIGNRPRLLLSDHCSLRQQYAAQPRMLKTMQLAMAATYRLADAVVGVSQGVSTEIAEMALLPRSKVSTIYNPVGPPRRSNPPPSDQTLWAERSGKRILSVGSLKSQKNHSLLLKAFAEFSQKTQAVLAIIGEGPERQALEAEIIALDLQDKVLLPGFTANPGDYYTTADLFVLSSDYEGMGNVIVEALHCGLPIVSTDCEFGPREILQPRSSASHTQTYGQLVPTGNAPALCAAMQNQLATPPDQHHQKNRAHDFAIDIAVDAYLSLLLPQKA